MAKSIVTIARLGWAEIFHKKILIAAAVLTLSYLALFGIGLHFLTSEHTFDELGATQLFTMGLYLAALLTSLLAALVGVGAIAGEVESGTAYALLARPVFRSTVLLGKYLGYATFMAGYAGAFFLGLWVLMGWQGGVWLSSVGEALGLFVLEPLVLLALTFVCSSLFSTLGAGVIVLLLYGVSLVGGMVEQIGALLGQAGHTGAPALVNVGIISSLVLPVDALYRRAAFSLLENSSNLWQGLGAMGPFGITSIPSIWMVVYAVVYLVAALWLAVRVFGAKDI